MSVATGNRRGGRPPDWSPSRRESSDRGTVANPLSPLDPHRVPSWWVEPDMGRASRPPRSGCCARNRSPPPSLLFSHGWAGSLCLGGMDRCDACRARLSPPRLTRDGYWVLEEDWPLKAVAALRLRCAWPPGLPKILRILVGGPGRVLGLQLKSPLFEGRHYRQFSDRRLSGSRLPPDSGPGAAIFLSKIPYLEGGDYRKIFPIIFPETYGRGSLKRGVGLPSLSSP